MCKYTRLKGLGFRVRNKSVFLHFLHPRLLYMLPTRWQDVWIWVWTYLKWSRLQILLHSLPPTPDPTVAHIPVMWVLMLADRVENRWAGEEKRWGREYVHYVAKWQERDSSQMYWEKQGSEAVSEEAFWLIKQLKVLPNNSVLLIPFHFRCGYPDDFLAKAWLRILPPVDVSWIWSVSWHYLF